MYDGCGGIDVAPGVASIRAPRTGTGVTEVGEVVGDAGGDLDLESVTLPLWGETVEEAAMIRLGDAFSLALDPAFASTPRSTLSVRTCTRMAAA